jgi:antitoxin component YwqK of YwqJK toxin-antitoxin module
MDGIEELFYENGNINWRTPYAGGEVHGIEEYLDEQGNITQTRHWEHGELIEITTPKLF